MITLIRFFIKFVDNNINMIYNIRAKRQRRNTMTKREMLNAWTETWEETKKVYEHMKKEYELFIQVQQNHLEKQELREAHAMSGMIASLRKLIIELEDVLYKEV